MSDVNTNNSSRRQIGFIILGVVIVLAGLAYGAYWFLDARFYESTDDAYVSGDIVAVKVGELHADEATLILGEATAVDDGKVALADARGAISSGLRSLAIARAQQSSGAVASARGKS